MVGWGKCVEDGVEVILGGWCVGGAGEQDGLGAFPQLLDTMLPDVCSKHVPASIVKVSCPLHRHLFWTALTNYIAVQESTARMLPHLVAPPVCLLKA